MEKCYAFCVAVIMLGVFLPCLSHFAFVEGLETSRDNPTDAGYTHFILLETVFLVLQWAWVAGTFALMHCGLSGAQTAEVKSHKRQMFFAVFFVSLATPLIDSCTHHLTWLRRVYSVTRRSATWYLRPSSVAPSRPPTASSSRMTEPYVKTQGTPSSKCSHTSSLYCSHVACRLRLVSYWSARPASTNVTRQARTWRWRRRLPKT